jgi:uncharacterized protein (TIRG00374 family)
MQSTRATLKFMSAPMDGAQPAAGERRLVIPPNESEAGPRRGAWSWILGGALAVFLLWYSLRGVDWKRVIQIIAGARWSFLAAAGVMMCWSFLLRAVRWRILLNAGLPDGEWLRVPAVFWANMAGYLGNNFLPARAGELIRSLLISRRSSLSKTYVLTTALSERLADVIALVLWSSVVLLRLETKPAWMADLSRTTATVAAGGVLAILILPHMGGKVEQILRRLPLPAALGKRLIHLAQEVLSGLRAFHHWGRFAGFAALTVVIWISDTAGIMVIGRSLGLDISFSVAMLLITGLGLGSALPSTPGYVGIFQFVAVTVLTPFGVGRDSAIAYILVIQALSYMTVAALGLPGMYKAQR